MLFDVEWFVLPPVDVDHPSDFETFVEVPVVLVVPVVFDVLCPTEVLLEVELVVLPPVDVDHPSDLETLVEIPVVLDVP